MADDLETVEFASAEEFEEWLRAHCSSSPGILLKLRKKQPGVAALDYAQALDVALCHGWIDGRKEAFDDRHWLQRFTPRRPRSRWSKVNRAKAEALIAQGRMGPAGLAEVERARADGRWDAAYDGQAAAVVPDDLAAALAANPDAAAFFATLDGRNRYSVLHRVQEAKRPETRLRRIETYVAMLAEGRTIHPRKTS
ncbi:YdeI/OmpD-associated family protein [Streptacidiphilus sp. ASG 303]|uniref:YdeI/OmpD-associated family protein n=1 Tax=Streptacidiphilus sp. ASG 303 TaxID=2896847 RepID=UPI001E60EDF1|nr:YdeI/OmpD-associated family protein [Streptacidiphilus sp. ASG 303]MCD0484343.1 YdeI/OmpD-associated family protein [Streptacidiphilus sp. ASG 303]